MGGIAFQKASSGAKSGEASERAAARRERLSEVVSALALVRHAKLGPLFGGPEAMVWLRWAAALARTVPVYGLEVVRDFARLPEVVAHVLEWHGEPAHRLEVVG